MTTSRKSSLAAAIARAPRAHPRWPRTALRRRRPPPARPTDRPAAPSRAPPGQPAAAGEGGLVRPARARPGEGAALLRGRAGLEVRGPGGLRHRPGRPGPGGGHPPDALPEARRGGAPVPLDAAHLGGRWAAAAAVVGAGGKVLEGPGSLGPRGRYVAVSDPRGAQFVLVTATGGDPPDLDAPPPGWIWAELWTDDLKGSAAFYRKVLGYETWQVGSGKGATWIFGSGGRPRARAARMPFEKVPAQWLPYVVVKDLHGGARPRDRAGEATSCASRARRDRSSPWSPIPAARPSSSSSAPSRLPTRLRRLRPQPGPPPPARPPLRRRRPRSRARRLRRAGRAPIPSGSRPPRGSRSRRRPRRPPPPGRRRHRRARGGPRAPT